MSSVDPNSASASRRIFFRSTGGTYSAMFMSDRGDLMQEYSQNADGTYTFYPDFTKNPVTLRLTVMSSKNTGSVSPVSVQYYANGKALKFNSSGTCLQVGDSTANSLTSLFKLNGDDLVIQGNIADFAGFASFLFTVEAFMSTTNGSETVTAHLQCTVAEYSEESPGQFTIESPDNYTISDKGGTCQLKARYTKGGKDDYPTGVKWEQLVSGSWITKVESTDNVNAYTVQEGQVATYSLFKASWNGFSDTAGVQDNSDPYDISLKIKRCVNGGDEEATENAELTDEMDESTSYLSYTPTMTTRGQNVSLSGKTVKWATGYLVTATGLNLIQITPDSSNVYKVYVRDLKAAGGVGEYDFVFSGTVE